MSSDRLAELTQSDWAEQIGSPFGLHTSAESVVHLTLAAAVKLGGSGTATVGKREPFGLIFRAGTREFLLPQKIYRLSHPVLGDLEIFLVPIGADEHGMRFEAIFA